MRELEQKLKRKIKTLNELLWGGRIKNTVLEKWLSNFDGALPESQEKIHALYILSCFMYFGNNEMRELLKVLYNELFKYRIISDIRANNNDTRDIGIIEKNFLEELKATKFFGVGNPSESGCHLLYFFRQENLLDKKLFASEGDILRFNRNENGDVIGVQLRHPEIKRYVFIDDFCGSGQQVEEYMAERIRIIKHLKKDAELWYCILFASSDGLQKIRDMAIFDKVDTVCELDNSYKCFRSNRYFQEYGDKLNKDFAKNMCQRYGNNLLPGHPLGYQDGQYLIGFNHNIPDNTLPIIWADNNNIEWHSIFKRYPKVNFNW